MSSKVRMPQTRKYPEYSSWSMPFPDTANLSYMKQTVEIELSAKDGESGIYRNAWSEFYDTSHPIVRKNLSQVFQSGYRAPFSDVLSLFKSYYKKSHSTTDTVFLHPDDEDSGKKPCLGHRPLLSLNPPTYASEFVWLSYEDVDKKRRDIGAALVWYFKRLKGAKKAKDIEIVNEIKDDMGLAMDTVSLWGTNTAEWQMVGLACQAYGQVVASLYDSSTNDIAEFILNHAEASILFLTIQHLNSVLSLFPKLKYLRSLVLMHSEEELKMYDMQGQLVRLAKAWATKLGVEIWDLQEFEQIGRQYPLEPMDLPSDAIYSLCYTSGTTGQPKAAILTHGQTAFTVSCATWGLQDYRPGISLSCLPLVHAYQRLINLSGFNRGGAIAFPIPDPQYTIEDMRLSKLTHICTVPRMLNKIYQVIMARFAGGGVKATVFNYALKTKMTQLRSTGDIHHPVWDKLIFNKIKPLFGGNLSTILCGSAAASPDVLDFIQVVLGCPVYNVYICAAASRYGLTETFVASCRVVPNDPTGASTIGPVNPITEAKLIDVPELGYFVRPPKTKNSNNTLDHVLHNEQSLRPRGELLLRVSAGARCLGYYKDPVSTKYTFDDEGWIHTGDIAELDDHGRFKIIDRKKNIIKLTHGEFVAVERIESMYSASPVLSQLFVYGDMSRDYLVAIVVPAEGLVVAATPSSSTSDQDYSSLKMHILEALEVEARLAGLKGYEKIRNIHISREMFSVDDGTLTPTLKIKRREAYEKYKDVIEELYKSPVSLPSSGSKKSVSKL